MSRENNRRYLFYAVGELALVVVGILIALQINNWNERRIEQREIEGFANALIRDLEIDLAMIEPIFQQMQFVQQKIDGLTAYMRDRPIEDVQNLELLYYTYNPYYRRMPGIDLPWNRSKARAP